MNEELLKELNEDGDENVFERIVSRGKQMSIPIENLEPSPYNTFDVEDISDLKNSVYLHGLFTPLAVIGPYENDKYTILSGERRYHAISEINQENPDMRMEEVPCYVVGDSSMDVVSQQLIIELSNIETREFNREDHRFQIVRLLKEQCDNGTISRRRMAKNAAKYLRCSPRYSRMYFAVFSNGTEKTVEAVKKSEIPLHIASNISNLPKEDQDVLLEDKEIMDSVKRRELNVKDASNIAKRPEEEKTVMIDAVKKGVDAKKVIETVDNFKEKKKKPIASETGQHYDSYQELDNMTDDDFDIDNDDDLESCMNFLTNNSDRVDLDLDTVGLHSELSQEEDEKDTSASIRKAIRVIEKLKRKTEFTEDEEELFNVMRDVLNYRDSLR